MMPEKTSPLLVPLTLALALSLSACANKQPTPPAVSPQLPPPPSLTTPLPLTPYSETAAKRMESWSKRLMDTQLMREPSKPAGQ